MKGFLWKNDKQSEALFVPWRSHRCLDRQTGLHSVSLYLAFLACALVHGGISATSDPAGGQSATKCR